MKIDELLAGDGGLILTSDEANFIRGYIAAMEKEQQRDREHATAAVEKSRRALEEERQRKYLEADWAARGREAQEKAATASMWMEIEAAKKARGF